MLVFIIYIFIITNYCNTRSRKFRALSINTPPVQRSA